jgi:uncharacterized membrane protein YraQ (UPF0718 family)
VVLGIAIGAGIHGYVLTDLIVKYAGVQNPLAVILEFTMAVAALSLTEMVILK